MATLTQEQVKQIIKDAPTGVSPTDIVQGLIERGHTLGGFGDSGVSAREPSKLEKTSKVLDKIFGGAKLGEAIGTSVAATGRLLKGDKQGFNDILDTQVSPKEVAGDLVNAVSTSAGFAGAGVTGGFLKKALTSGAMGAGMFGGRAASEDKSVGEIAKAGAIGATTGVVTSGALSTFEAAHKAVSGLPNRLIQSALGQSKKEILANKSLTKFVLENKKVGTADKLIQDSQVAMEKWSNQINRNLQSVPITKAKITTSSILDDIVRDINKQGGAIDKAEAKEIIERLAPQAKGLLQKPSMSLVTANKLRQSIDRTIGDRGFLTSELPFNKDVLRSFTNALREQVKSKAPEGTRAAFNSLANEIRLSNALANKVAQGSKNQVISFGDLIGGGLGGAMGGVPGALIGAGVRRGVQSTPFLTGSAVAIDRLDRTLSPVLEQLEPSVQALILKALQEAFMDEDTENSL